MLVIDLYFFVPFPVDSQLSLLEELKNKAGFSVEFCFNVWCVSWILYCW